MSDTSGISAAEAVYRHVKDRVLTGDLEGGRMLSEGEVSTTLALPPTVALVQPQAIVVRVLVTELQGTKTILVSPRIANEAPNVTYVLTPPAVSVASKPFSSTVAPRMRRPSRRGTI